MVQVALLALCCFLLPQNSFSEIPTTPFALRSVASSSSKDDLDGEVVYADFIFYGVEPLSASGVKTAWFRVIVGVRRNKRLEELFSGFGIPFQSVQDLIKKPSLDYSVIFPELPLEGGLANRPTLKVTFKEGTLSVKQTLSIVDENSFVIQTHTSEVDLKVSPFLTERDKLRLTEIKFSESRTAKDHPGHTFKSTFSGPFKGVELPQEN
jgi:hypothetical protein